MTEALQSSPAFHFNGTRAAGTRMDVNVLSTSMDQSLDVLRFTRSCGGRNQIQLHMMIDQPPTVFEHQALSRNPSSIITNEDTDLRAGLSPAQSQSVKTVNVVHVLAASARNPSYRIDIARDVSTQ